MNNIIIVDQNDNPIGTKKRGTIDPKNDIIRTAFVWVTNSKNQVLLAQRKLTKKYCPGMWGPAAGGTVEEGETYESNIYKEAQEEIGLTGVIFTPDIKVLGTEPNMRFGQSFLATTDHPIENFKLQEDEVEQIKWIDLCELQADIQKNPDSYTLAVHIMLQDKP